MYKSNDDQKQQITESLKKYLIRNGYTKTLVVLERDRVFKTPPRKSARLSFAIIKAPKRAIKIVTPVKNKKTRKKKELESEKSKYYHMIKDYFN
jgi:nucleosome binding factor SPN SPT16 subunit